MLVLRSLLFLLLQVLTAIPFSLLAVLVWGFPARLRSRIIGSWAHLITWLLGKICKLYYRVEGAEQLPERAVLISNHQSAWETIAYQVIFPPQAWVLKRELLWIPIFGWGLAATVPIAIDRKSPRKALERVVSEGRERLNGGRWVVVFPEGTRIPPGDVSKYNPGGALLAVKAGVPIVPVAHNAGIFWPRRGFIKHPGTIEVVVGEPIETAGRKAKEVNLQVEQWIRQQQVRLPGQLVLG
ncbi:MAG TPA: 1-acyl-sn-glycerol-3-phosphate acyltransferase [Gammaproteobacteria bacterium]|nr:1-acyl-sn-glycerol-3-phosphate acyltransferase [Gammaproteobacteria bacterium]